MNLINGKPIKEEVQECIDAIHRGSAKFHINYRGYDMVMVGEYVTKAEINLLCFYLTSENTKAELVYEHNGIDYGVIKITVL